MQLPIDITFRDMPPSPALTDAINEWAAKLEKVFPLQRCAVTVEMPHKHQRQGRAFHVTVAITVPGHEIAVSRDSGKTIHEDAHLAVADAFRAARRQLIDFAAARRDARPVL